MYSFSHSVAFCLFPVFVIKSNSAINTSACLPLDLGGSFFMAYDGRELSQRVCNVTKLLSAMSVSSHSPQKQTRIPHPCLHPYLRLPLVSIFANLLSMKLHLVFMSPVLTTSKTEHHFTRLLTIWVSSSADCLFVIFTLFLNRPFFLFVFVLFRFVFWKPAGGLLSNGVIFKCLYFV